MASNPSIPRKRPPFAVMTRVARARTAIRTQGRYLVPNIITAASLLLGLVSIHASLELQFANAAWLILICTILDKLDGTSARLLRATSAFGVELDSFADFCSFGMAPVFLCYQLLTKDPTFQLSADDLLFLKLACALLILASALRLARFNTQPGSKKYMLGLATTAVGGLLASFVLVGLEWREVPWMVGTIQALPFIIMVCAVLEVSTFRMVKLDTSGPAWLRRYIVFNSVFIPLLILMRQLPEWIFFAGFTFVLGSLGFGIWRRAEIDAAMAEEIAQDRAAELAAAGSPPGVSPSTLPRAEKEP